MMMTQHPCHVRMLTATLISPSKSSTCLHRLYTHTSCRATSINTFHSTSLLAKGVRFSAPPTFPRPQSLWRRCHLQYSCQHLHPPYSIPYKFQRHTRQCFKCSHKDSTCRPQKLLFKVSDWGRSEFKPPERCKGSTHVGLGNGPDTSSACTMAFSRIENRYFTFCRYSLSAPCSLFISFHLA